jgi:hypothetical protein
MQMRLPVIPPAACLLLVALPGPTAHAQITTDLPTDPARAIVVYDDVQNFARVLKRMENGDDLEKALQEEYFDRASPGLREYARRYELTAASMANAINRRRRSYAALSDLPERLVAQEEMLRREFAGLKRLIPNAVFAPAYYVIGDWGGASSASEQGILISVERYRTARASVRIAIHEAVHIQQVLAQGIETYRRIYGPDKSLLALVIREGTANFLAALVTGGQLNEQAYEYVVAHEKEVWKRFSREMNGPETGDWMWQRPVDRDQPYDVGYALGARIVAAYYERAADKEVAIREMLAVTDYRSFLERSGYVERFKR